MKSKRKTKTIILLILGFLIVFLPFFTTHFNFKSTECSDLVYLDNEDLKSSKVSGKILIVNNSGWVDFRNAGNCTGNGTYSEPYVIEDLEIDGGSSGSCIQINNSNVYFRIENCTVFNSGHYGSGIYLSHVNNSILIDNNCLYNYGYGIYLDDCYNNSVSGNIANHNNDDGMYLRNSHTNFISGNNLNSSTYVNGITLYYCDNLNISGNNLSSTYGIGIFSNYCNNLTISGNIMNNGGLRISGSLEELSSHSIDTTNVVNGKSLYYYANQQ
ncbi:MAG: right-handed parallel beta-helix repeat-containing protein, partial [Candidatus Lokiarchaeia archaeon]|nr:right-handed parallel beta-helix repeat-containing protein [Candidatus Lokiarchaeia archaeon]